MQSLRESKGEEYTFETVPEVQEKIQNAKNLHQLISEESVQDLEYVDVSNRAYCKVKRVLDFLLAAVGLIILAVPIAALAAVIYLDNPGDVFFSQYRIGMNGKRFKLYKFRSMKMDTPKYQATMELDNPEQYFTRAGKTMRKLSLDEIPQLLNVLKGDMSLIGPRPLIADEYEIHAMRMRFGVYNIRPGITGLAQINGRDMVGPEEKLRWDVQYLKKFGWLTDIKILLVTIPKVLRKEGFVEENSGKQDET